MSAKYESWAGASKVLGQQGDGPSWGGAKPGSAGASGRFDMPKASITYDARGGRMVYGLPERFGTRIHQHGFEATKRAENDVEEKLSMTAGGRRHLEHQYQLAMGEKEETAFETARRPTKGQAYHKNWSTSSDHPLYTGATAGSEHGGVAELLTAQGTTARMYKPIDALRPEIPPRYIARNMYDARREEENLEDEVRMSRMRDARERFRGGFVQTRSEVIDLAVEYPHGAPASVRRQMAAQGVSILGSTQEMANLNSPFTRHGYANY